MRILMAQINPTIGDLKGNTEKIIEGLKHGRDKGAELVLFPELCLSGYPPDDFLLLPHFIDAVEASLQAIIKECKNITALVGLPRNNPDQTEKGLFNSAAVIENQTLLGFQDKMLLPTYDVFAERRYFEPSAGVRLWKICGQRVAVTICEDLWQHSQLLASTNYRRDPVMDLQMLQPDLLLNLSASPFSGGKAQMRFKVCSKAAETLSCPVLLCNQVGGNDSLIFDGYSLYVDAAGQLIDNAKGFEEDFFLVDLDASLQPKPLIVNDTEDLYRALVLGLRDYFRKSGFKKACLGISGGIDSALVACIAAEALGPENVLGVCMPSRYSSESSTTDAKKLADNLKIQYREIPIEGPFQSYLEPSHSEIRRRPPDTTEENIQARIRGMILMAISNKFGLHTLEHRQ